MKSSRPPAIPVKGQHLLLGSASDAQPKAVVSGVTLCEAAQADLLRAIAEMDQLQVVATRVGPPAGQQVLQSQRAASQVVDKYLTQDKENSGVRWGPAFCPCPPLWRLMVAV